ncbi:MAG: FAD:protein FMN transferase [Runella slithyformis]|nr:MAG: FAD:protein FMN transferase [Runella slithyformis]
MTVRQLITILLFIVSTAQAQERYEFSAVKLGTLCKIIFYAPDSAFAHSASQKAWKKIDELNEILSDYNENSEIRRLADSSGMGRKIQVSKVLYDIIEHSLEFSRLSKGAFDITIGSYVQLWRRARRQAVFPTQEQLAKAKKATGYQKIKLYPKQQSVKLKAKGMRLDVGGIGKGFIADEVLKLLDSMGISAGIVDLGGDISISNAPPQQEGWRIETGYKDKAGLFVSRELSLKNCAVATSGDLYQFVSIGGKRYSHIINPKTGIGLTEMGQVTVIAPNGTAADALASAVSVLGKRKGMKLAQKLKNITLLLLD